MKNKELIVGVFAAIVLALLYFGFNYLKGIDFFSKTNNFYAKYRNVSELAVSNPVLVNGFIVGRVSQINLIPKEGNSVLVELEIDSKVIVGKGAKATLSSGLLGNKSILLNPGDITKPLNSNDTIIAELAKGMLDIISETASPVAYDMQTTLKKFNGIIDDLTKTLKVITPVIQKFDGTPSRINTLLEKTGDRLDDVTITVRQVSDKLKGTLNELDPTLQNFKVISDSIKQLELNQTLKKTQESLASITDFLAELKKGDNTASKLMTDDSLYNNLNHLMMSLDSLSNHLNTHPKHFLGPLAKSSKRIERDHKKDQERKKATKP